MLLHPVTGFFARSCHVFSQCLRLISSVYMLEIIKLARWSARLSEKNVGGQLSPKFFFLVTRTSILVAKNCI